MTFAQFECAHDAKLMDRDDGNDVDDAMIEAHFGSAAAAAVVAAAPDGQRLIERKYIKCTLRYDATHDARLYGKGVAIHPLVSPDGIVSARVSGLETLFLTRELGIDIGDQMVGNELYPEPYTQAQANDLMARMGVSIDRETQYVITPSKVRLPVLVYNGTVVVDYRNNQDIVYDNDPYKACVVIHGGNLHHLYTQHLYSLPDVSQIITVKNGQTYIRTVKGDDKLPTTNPLKTALVDSCDRLCVHRPGGAETAPTSGIDLPWHSQYPTYQPILGGDLPLKICNNEFVIAPIAKHGSHGIEIETFHNAILDADTLAAHLRVGTKANSMGIAMQKFSKCQQGDVMLHDGT